MNFSAQMLVFTLSALSVLLPGPAAGEVARAQRSISSVERIDWSAAGELHVKQGETESLVIEAEPRLLPKITSEVKGGTLYLGFGEASVATQKPVRFFVTVRSLTALRSQSSGSFSIGSLTTPSLTLRLEGSSDTTIDSLDAKELNVAILGSADVAIKRGFAVTQVVEIAGSGYYGAARMASRNATVTISGSGDANVAADKHLLARISGAGEIVYRGKAVVSEVVEGAGQVRRLGYP